MKRKEYYQENRFQLYQTEQLNAPSILLPLPNNSSIELKMKLKSLATELPVKLRSEIELGSLRKTYPKTLSFLSKGYFPLDRLTPEVADVVLQSNLGEVSNPIQVGIGILVFILKERLPKQELPLDQVIR